MVTLVTIGYLGMADRKTVFSVADSIWLRGTKPSVRNVRDITGGSYRDIGPLLKVWWHERTSERKAVAHNDLARLEEQFDEQRRYYMMQIDLARTETRTLQQQLQAAVAKIDYYKKLLKDEVPVDRAFPPSSKK